MTFEVLTAVAIYNAVFRDVTQFRSVGTSVLNIATLLNIPEDGILHRRRREKPQILHSINRLGSLAET
jgi:hypothetical protein